MDANWVYITGALLAGVAIGVFLAALRWRGMKKTQMADNLRQTEALMTERDNLIRLQSSALNVAVNAVVISDVRGYCIWVNRAFSDITGYLPEEVVGKSLSILKSGVQGDDYYKNLWQTITSGKIWVGEIVNKHKSGRLYWEEMTIAPVYNEKHELTNYIAIKQDITLRKKMEAESNAQMQEILTLQRQLREQAIRDPLTGLYNRRVLEEALEREVSNAQRDDRGFCIAMIDLDNFKNINDRFGHQAGDLVLKSLAKILDANTRRGDITCRYGGEEFSVLMPNASLEGAQRRAQQWRKAFQLQHQIFNGQDVQITLSIGVAHYPDHGADGHSVLDAADKAMYRSKQKGKNQVNVFGQE